jgi:dolichol-phosphate mannosyltransferase
MSYLGISFTFIAFIGVIVQLILRFILSDIPSGFTTVIILILFFGGINLLAISFIGEYVSKIFEETKKRPKFIRKKIIIGSNEYKTKSDIQELDRIKERKTLIKN